MKLELAAKVIGGAVVGVLLFLGGYLTGRGYLPVKAHDPQAIQASDLTTSAESQREGHLADVWVPAKDNNAYSGYCWSNVQIEEICGKWVPVKELVERLVRDAGYEWTPGAAATEGSLTKPKAKGAR